MDTLFGSLARVYGRGAVGVVLSGMGGDGGRGVAELKAAGALVFAQDEHSSIIYGMPKVAREAGASSLPLGDIAQALVQAVAKVRAP